MDIIIVELNCAGHRWPVMFTGKSKLNPFTVVRDVLSNVKNFIKTIV